MNTSEPRLSERKLADGWWIPHPGTLEWQPCESFEEAMNEWFEGFNLPRMVTNGIIESISTANERVANYYNGIFPLLNRFPREPEYSI